MRSPIRFSAMVLMSALLGTGCDGTQPQGAEVVGDTVEVKQGAVGDRVLRCDEFQGGSYLEVVQAATGFEATFTFEDRNSESPDGMTRIVLGQYEQCRRSTVDARILNCFSVRPGNILGKVILSTTRVQRTQMVLGSSTTVSYSDLSVAAINQEPGQTPRRDYNFSLNDCQ